MSRIYFPGLSGEGWKSAAASQRSGGVSTIASTPFRSRFQNASGESAPPGNLQPTPTMAIGSVCWYSMLSSWDRRLEFH